MERVEDGRGDGGGVRWEWQEAQWKEDKDISEMESGTSSVRHCNHVLSQLHSHWLYKLNDL